jgi:MoaA/NifB/PqqE/SkfB family radical SAM enzyme
LRNARGRGHSSVWERLSERDSNNVLLLKQPIGKICSPSTLEVLGIHLADHCNLKCAGCSHFSPLAKESFADFNETEKDIKRLAYLTKSKVKQIVLQGGEPLLHENCSAFMKMVRLYFPKTHIYLLTNGILLVNQSLDFWETCKKQKIDIAISLYPININIDQIKKKCKEYNIDLFYAGKKDDAMFRIPIDPSGKCDGNRNFEKCVLGQCCSILRNGKLFPCPASAYIHYFSEYFDKNIPVTDRDFIDIYKINSLKEMLAFFQKSKPFCNYCDLTNIVFNLKWQISKRNIAEWT